MFKKINTDAILTIILTVISFIYPLYRLISYTMELLGIDGFIFDIVPAYIVWVSLPILMFIYVYNVLKKKYVINVFDYLIFILMIIGIISTMFALNKEWSFLGNPYRNEGLISICTYFYIFLNVKNIKSEKYKEYLINLVLFIGIIHTIYAYLQVFTDLSFIRRFGYDNMNYMGFGLVGNPNFYGSYLVICLGITITYFLTTNKIYYLFLSCIYFSGIVLAASTGPFLTICIIILFILICLNKRLKIGNYLILILMFILIFINTSTDIVKYNQDENIIYDYNISKELDVYVNEVKNDSPTIDISTGRKWLWKTSFPYIKDYWLVGAGYDNFMYAFPVVTSDNLSYDKAHNIYLEMAICSGVPYLIVYCILCLIIFIKGFKLKDSFYLGLYIAFVGYSIQGFANINVVDVTWIFFLVIGLLSSKISLDKKKV